MIIFSKKHNINIKETLNLNNISMIECQEEKNAANPNLLKREKKIQQEKYVA